MRPRKMLCVDYFRYGNLLNLALIQCYPVFGNIKANESEANMMLLNHFLKIGSRLDNIEKRLGDLESTKQVPYAISQKEAMSSMVQDIKLKTGQMSKAFAAEKKELRIEKDEILKSLNQSTNLIAELKRASTKHSARLNDFKQSVDDFESDRHDDEQKTNQSLERIAVDVSDIRNDIVNIKRIQNELVNHGELERDKTKKIKRSIESISDQILETRREMNNFKGIVDTIRAIVQCPEGWDRQLDSCILYESVKKGKWAAAQRYCKTKLGILAEPYTEEAFILLRGRTPVYRESWFLGASDRKREGYWIWESTSTPMSLRRWGPDEPNDIEGGEDCLDLYDDTYLNDNSCNKKANFICEIKLF